jgi:phosphopantothenoylcysteine decarboxylase
MNILLGVTGGISAYKAADIIGALKYDGHESIRVIMSEKAKEYITPLTLATLSKGPVYDDMLEWTPHGRVDHIELAEWAEVFIIAPASANTIAKLAYGFADNLLTSTYLAFYCAEGTGKSFILCPAMNNRMYENETTQGNILKLKKPNHYIIPPVEGMLACGTIGIGKLTPTKTIIDTINRIYE